ncbi:MAG: hypothetical protein LJE83_03550 [Gammaproteobacteria bacterium]|nr:hypothetical protein [Gammaproteobacteria bacterium]
MNKFITFPTSTALLLGAFLITACSSSGGGGGGTSNITFDGTTTAAIIDSTNAEAIGTASGEAIQKADASTGLPTLISISNTTNMDELNNIVISSVNTSNLPAGLDISSGLCTSGNASISDIPQVQSGPVALTITYNNCALSGSTITVNGTVFMDYDDISNPSNFSITYSNFTVTDPDNGTTTVNMTMICTNSSCTINSDFVGSDGVTHRITNFSIVGDASSGFSGSASFFHGTYGEVNITFNGITYGGCGAVPDGGNINFTGSSSSSGSITFNSDCTVSGTWDTGSTAGSF